MGERATAVAFQLQKLDYIVASIAQFIQSDSTGCRWHSENRVNVSLRDYAVNFFRSTVGVPFVDIP
jgi:hypothetical protein